MTIRARTCLLGPLLGLFICAAPISIAEASPLFHSSLSTTTLTAQQDGPGKAGHHVIDAGKNGSITCSTVDFHGTQSGTTAETVTYTAEYSNCTFLGLSAFFRMNACDYVIHSTGTLDIAGANCSVQPIKFGVEGLCEVTIGPHSGLHELTYTNISPDQITVETHVTGIHGVATGAFCPAAGTFTDGEYTTGRLIITAAGGEAELRVE